MSAALHLEWLKCGDDDGWGDPGSGGMGWLGWAYTPIHWCTAVYGRILLAVFQLLYGLVVWRPWQRAAPHGEGVGVGGLEGGERGAWVGRRSSFGEREGVPGGSWWSPQPVTRVQRQAGMGAGLPELPVLPVQAGAAAGQGASGGGRGRTGDAAAVEDAAAASAASAAAAAGGRAAATAPGIVGVESGMPS